MRVRIDWDRLHEYRAILMDSIPSDFVPWNLYETMEYYLINASEDGWTDEEKEKFINTAKGISETLHRMFNVPGIITDAVMIEEN